MSVGLRRFGSHTSFTALMAVAFTVLVHGTAIAQDQAADQPGAAPEMEEIVVTGSHIASQNATSANPLTVVTAAQIQQSEAITLEQFLLKVPAVDFSNGISSNDNNGGLGAATVGLKNLGPPRTLVLVNGQRFPFTDTQGSTAAVDLNNIPLSMIDHTEILEDGASSIYGADAIAGVINIITKQSYQGFEVGGSVGSTSYNDGTQYSTYATLGQNFARGNILVNLSYDHKDPIPAANRYWATNEHPEAFLGGNGDGVSSVSSRVTGAIGIIGGTEYYFPSGINSAVPASNAAALLGAKSNNNGIYYTGGGLSPGDVAVPAYGGVFFDYLPTEYLQGALDRKQANFTSHYDLTDNITAVLEGFYTNRQSQEELNPEPLGFNVFTSKFPQGLYVPAYYQQTSGGPLLANPYFPTALYTSATGAAPTTSSVVPILTRRFENGPRVYNDNISTYRFRFALQGTLYDDYHWEAGYFYGRSDATYQVQNEVNLEHALQLAGAIPCGADAANGCSVANYFGYNSLTPAQSKYLVFDNTEISEYSESVAYGNISGKVPFVPELPGGPIKASIGFEYRTENGFANPDTITQQGDATVFSEATAGGYTVGSGYIEVQAPILGDLPFVKSFDIDASARYDYYSTFGRALTYKAGLNWAIDDDFRIRGSNSTGFRAPQVKELYGGTTQDAPGGSDPCATGGAYATTPACLKVNGGNPASLTQVNQLTTLIGGNAALRPETSQQWNAGGVFTPTFIPNFTFSVDYYTVLIRDEIGSYDPNALLNACYGGVAYVITQTAACSLITRQGPGGTGNLGFVDTINGNIADENTDGLEFAVSYGFNAEKVDLPFDGHFQINGSATYLLSDDLISLGGGKQQFAGTFNNTNVGANSGEPRWKATVSLGYSQDNWSVLWTSRYYGGLKNADQSTYCVYGTVTCPTVGAGDFEGNETAGVFYHDIAITYTLDNYSMTVGVDNLFDKSPPFLITNGDVYIGAAGYDNTGRFAYLKATAKFGAGQAAAPAEAAAYVPPPAQAPMPASVAHSYMVFFDFNKSDLSSQAVAIVDQAAKNAAPAKATELVVTGHTDTVGSDAYNMRLSRRRAESVAAELEKMGIKSSEIEIVAKGKKDLLVPTADGVREPQNRRVTIVYGGAMTS